MNRSKYDVVILGAGHNGLVAASYLGRAGLSVLLLEKNDYIGGATTSQKIFPDYDACLSRYAYLVSLFPQKIIRDLGLNLELRRRGTASFTPYVNHGHHGGLLLSNLDEELSRKSFVELTGSDAEFERLKKFYALPRKFAEQIWDAMLGVLTRPHESSLVQNRCFLYHLIGNKTGEWKVPVGGMGAVSSELERVARKAGAEILTKVNLHGLNVTDKTRSVEFRVDGKQETVEARFLLVNFGRNVLAKFTGRFLQPDRTDEGSVFKINMLLRRLPKLKAKKYPAADAFSGTFHSDEGYAQMNISFDQASEGRLPERTPCEMYCHTLTDDSILAPDLREQGFHTMTLFGLDAPWNLFVRDNANMRREAERRFLAS